MHNSKCQCHMAACCTYHRPTCFSAAKQGSYKKAHLIMKNIEEFSGKSSGEWASRQKKDRKSCRQAVQLVDKSQPCLFTLVYFIY